MLKLSKDPAVKPGECAVYRHGEKDEVSGIVQHVKDGKVQLSVMIAGIGPEIFILPAKECVTSEDAMFYPPETLDKFNPNASDND